MAIRKTKIVCTIGPASEQVDTLEKMIDSGMNVARLNFSHGDFKEHENRINNIRTASEHTGKTTAILLDTKGPEIRTGSFQNGQAELVESQTVFVSMKDMPGTSERFSITYSGLIDDVYPGSKILLDDGLIELEVLDVDREHEEIKTKALNSGQVKNKKGVNVPNVKVKLPGITDKDRADIEFGVRQGIDFIAASFVRRRSDILEIKELLEQHNATHIHIIPKIENQEGIDNIDEILEVSDGLMVARGDLGVEIPAEDVPLAQKYMIEKCNNVGKPVITATQMLDSMQRNPRPTRAEASDVANAIFDGTDAIMLSGETAAGHYPIESVKTMGNIAVKAESGLDHKLILEKRANAAEMTITDAISQSATRNARDLGVSALVTPTESGHTARMIAKYRPKCPIIAVTPKGYVSRQLSLAWGVHAIVGASVHTTDEMLDNAIESGLKTSLFHRGDRVIITAGVPAGESGTTNLMKVHVIGDILTKGQGIGLRSAYGKAVVAKDGKQILGKITEDSILVTYGTDRDMMPAIEKAAGIITTEGGLTSHAAVVGLSLGIPVIVGVKDAFDIITDDMEITIDGTKGDIYKGHTSVI